MLETFIFFPSCIIIITITDTIDRKYFTFNTDNRDDYQQIIIMRIFSIVKFLRFSQNMRRKIEMSYNFTRSKLCVQLFILRLRF